jgi:ribosomal 50S subunit-recycling heat shock protein
VRIDVFFKKTLLFKKRSEAKTICDKKLVKVNGVISKPSKSVNPGDIIEIDTFQGTRKIKILEIPGGNVKKNETANYYEEELIL